MGFLAYFKDVLIVGSILSLLIIGLLITLKSGLVTVGGDRCQMILGNFSRLILALAGLLLVLGMLQQLVGVRVGL